MEYETSDKRQKVKGRNQRKDVTIVDVVRMSDTEEKAEAWFVQQRWPNGVYCPHRGLMNVVDVKDCATNKAHSEVIESADTPTLTGLVAETSEPSATVVIDEWRVYNPLEKMGYEHGQVRYSGGQYVGGMAHTNGVESFWAMMNRDYRGTYHQMSTGHLHRYVAEFRGRYIQRSRDTLAQMSEFLRGGDGKQATYGELIANGPHALKRMEELAA